MYRRFSKLTFPNICTNEKIDVIGVGLILERTKKNVYS